MANPAIQVRRTLARAEFAAPTDDGELVPLLSKRLQLISIVGALAFAMFTVAGLARFDEILHPSNLGWPFSVMLSTAILLGAAASVLALHRWTSLRLLRFVEFLVMTGIALTLMALRWGVFGQALAHAAAEPGQASYFVSWVAAYNSAGWVMAIMAYGLIVPNTRMRATATIGTLAALPLLHDLALIATRPGVITLLLYPLYLTGMFLFIAVFSGLFGSFRIIRLHEEARAARAEIAALGEYRLLEPLGSGGMGEVFLAEHRLLKRPCAVKLIRPELAGSTDVLRRFEREVQAITRINHPNVVHVYDYGHTADGTFYYAMEYLPGLSLEDLVARYGPQPAARVTRILEQVCDALREAHAHGLLHRDIKPGNIMLCRIGDRADVAKLLDFGIVQDMASLTPATALTQAGVFIGSPDYVSPEQASAERSLTAASDLYSLAATACYALSGRPPFRRRTIAEVLVAHIIEPPPPLAEWRPDLPAELSAVVLRGLAKDPADRFATALEFRQALQQCACADWTDADALQWWETRDADPAMPQ